MRFNGSDPCGGRAAPLRFSSGLYLFPASLLAEVRLVLRTRSLL
ncbi:hypothetical protein PF011_g29080, partial [Phytophthora fragariae]